MHFSASAFKLLPPVTYGILSIAILSKTGEGWMYLATVIDLYSRCMVGWSMSNRMTVDLVIHAAIFHYILK